MNGKKAKAERRASAPPSGSTLRSAGFWRSWKGGALTLGVAAVVSLSFVLPDILNQKSVSAGAQQAIALGAKQGTGLPIGSAVPSFSARDLVSGKAITSSSLYGHKTLLFFSEGVMCQACLEQIQGLQQVGSALSKRGIELVSITPDSAGELRQAVAEYGITTPVIADTDRSLSEAFNTLGAGMHADTPGHAFALIGHGKVLWYRDYYQPPSGTMYVQPSTLLADIPRV